MKIAMLALAALAFAAPSVSAQYTTQYPTQYQYPGQVYVPQQPTYIPTPVTPANTYVPLPCTIPYYTLTEAEKKLQAVKQLANKAITAQKAVQVAVTKAGEYFQANGFLLSEYYRLKAISDYTKENKLPTQAADLKVTNAAKAAAKVPLAAYEKLVKVVETKQALLVKADDAVQVKATAVVAARKGNTKPAAGTDE